MTKSKSPPLPPPQVQPYDKAAGGWDALKASAQALREQAAIARGTRSLLRANQPSGFDCPGCAWPDRNPQSTFEFCENGVKAVAAEATSRRADAAFFAAHSIEALAAQDDLWLEAQGRLTEPMLLEPGATHYQPISWEAALAMLGSQLRALDSVDRAVFYTSGRTSNEAAYLYQLFVRAYGSNHLPDCSNLCHEPSGMAMIEQIGSGKGSVTLADFEQAEAIFLFGQNPGTNHPRMLGELRSAARRGCRIVAVNPLRERGMERFTDPQSPGEMLGGGSTQLASLYLNPRIGGDLALLWGMLRLLLAWDRIDHAFVARHCQGYAALVAAADRQAWSQIESHSGLSRVQIEAAARILADSEATIFCWGMGITQHRRSVATIQMLLNLLLLRGQIGRPGAGPCPVRGHSNVQGDRTMGINERPTEAFLARLGRTHGFDPPRQHGYDVIGAIEAMGKGEVDVFFALGGNFAAASPDTVATHAALRRCQLTAHVSTKLNRSHLVHGRRALILPCLGRTEVDQGRHGPQSVSVEDSMSMVHLSCGGVPPASSQLRSEPAIVAGLAQAALPDSRWPWQAWAADYDEIRDLIAQTIDGFEDFNARVRQPGGFHLPHPARKRQWPTASGKAGLYVHELANEGAKDPSLLQLMTVRSHDQYNTTIYGLRDRYRGVHGERRPLFINATDLQALGFSAGERVDVVSLWHDGERLAENFLLVEYAIPSGCVASYFPETNVLVPLDHHAEGARTPASKSIPVRLRRRPPS